MRTLPTTDGQRGASHQRGVGGRRRPGGRRGGPGRCPARYRAAAPPGPASTASAARRPLVMAWAMPSPCSGFTRPAASPVSRTRPAAGVVPTMPIFSHPPSRPSLEPSPRPGDEPHAPEVLEEGRQQPDRPDPGPPVRPGCRCRARRWPARRARGTASRSRGRRARARAPTARCGGAPRSRRGRPAPRTPTAPGGGRRAPPASPTRLVAPSAPMTTSARSRRPPSSSTSSAPDPVPGAPTGRRPGRDRSPPAAPASRAASAARRRTPGGGGPRRSRGSRCPRSTAAAAAAPTGPPPPCPRGGAPAPSGARPRSPSTATPRGPTASPQALSRGKVALSTSATRAPARARTSALTAPAGPEPTTATSKCSGDHRNLRHRRAFCGIVAPCAETHSPPAPATAGSPAACSPASPTATTGWRSVLSLGQNGRWRRAMVDHVVAGKPRLVLDVATGPAGVALQLAAAHRRPGRRRRPHRGDDPPGPGQRGARRGRRSRCRWCWAGASSSPSPTPPSTPSPSPTSSATSRTPRPPCASWPGWCGPAGTVANLEFLVPASRFWRFWWWGYTRLVLPLGGALTGGREWFTRGPVPRAQHLGPLPPLPAGVDGAGVARGGDRRRRRCAP